MPSSSSGPDALQALRSIVGKNDGREVECLEFVRAHAKQGDAASVLAQIDKFASTTKWMMNVGDRKGEILKQSLRRANPKLVLELGAYCGYSAITMAAASSSSSSSQIVSVEKSSKFADITRQMAQFAGLGDRITVLVGVLSDAAVLQQLKQKTTANTGSGGAVDFVFVDHAKEAYLPDLLVLLREGLLRPGSVVFADNCLTPGAPDYVAYMDANPALFATSKFMTKLEYQDQVDDMVLESTLLKSTAAKL